MLPLRALLQNPLVDQLGWTLFHFLWQGVLIAVLTAIVLHFLRRATSDARYGLGLAAFCLLAICPLITFWYLGMISPPKSKQDHSPHITNPAVATTHFTEVQTEFPQPVRAQRVPASGNKQTGTPPSAATEESAATATKGLPPRSLWWRDKLDRVLPGLVAAWLVGVVALSIRMLGGWIVLQNLKRRGRCVVDPRLNGMLLHLGEQMGIARVVTLIESAAVRIPATYGWIRPVILLPATAVTGLSSSELESVLAHELAHIRRLDFLVNLFQVLVETLLFYHPAVWWLSKQIRQERENCCDDLAVGIIGDRSAYVRALTNVAALEVESPLLANAANGGELTARIRRLVGRRAIESTSQPRGVVGALLLVLLLATMAGLAIRQNVVNAQEKRSTTAGKAEKNQNEGAFAFRLKVVGPNGKPVPGASVDLRSSAKIQADHIVHGGFSRKHNYGAHTTCDDQGLLEVSLPERPTRLSVAIIHPGYAPFWAGWGVITDRDVIPREITAELDAGWSVGGVVVDDSGRPIPEVAVRPSIDFKKLPGDDHSLGIGTRIKTDAQGLWRFDSVPASKLDVHLSFDHPRFQSLRNSFPRSGFEVKPGVEPTAHFQLPNGLTITGVVADELGRPLAGALVRTKFHNDLRKAVTDEHGAYRLIGCEPRMTRIVVSAPGKALDLKEVRVDPEMEPVNFTMKSGGKLRVRVVDENGKGIPKARIFFQRWRGHIDYFEFDHVNQYADADGVWEWDEAPLDEIQVDIARPEGMQLTYQPLSARDEEYVFSPPKALVVSGRVIDAKTKQPIKKFRATPGLRNTDGNSWISGDSYEASADTYHVRFNRESPAHLVRIEANGYEVAISREIQSGEGEITIDFELEPAEDIAATIVSADGKPAGQAKIALGVAGMQINIKNGEIDDSSTYATKRIADAEGRFRIPNPGEAYQLVITHPSGFAYLKSVEDLIPATIELTPWARVEGTFHVGKAAVPNVVLRANPQEMHSYGNDVPNIFTEYTTTTGKDGRYAFERMFPGKGRVGRRILLMVDDGATEVTSSQMVPFDLLAGDTTKLDLGGNGRAIVGKLQAASGRPGKVLWNFALVNVRADLTPPPSPKLPAGIENDAKKRLAWWEEWKATDAGQAWTTAYEGYERLRSESIYMTASVDRDGTFRLDDVPPGKYVLDVYFSKNDAGRISLYRFMVPADDQGKTNDALDLGTLTLKAR